jgi:hypothetical protein
MADTQLFGYKLCRYLGYSLKMRIMTMMHVFQQTSGCYMYVLDLSKLKSLWSCFTTQLRAPYTELLELLQSAYNKFLSCHKE